MANTIITLALNKGSYGANNGSTPLSLSSFDYTFVKGSGTATGWTATSLTKVGGASVTGGESVVEVHGTLTGTANGMEKVVITPASGAAVYDVDGLAMESSQTIDAVMWGPFMDDFTGTTIDDDKWTVTMTDADAEFWQNDELILTVSGPVDGLQKIDTEGKHSWETAGNTTVVNFKVTHNADGATYNQFRTANSDSIVGINETLTGGKILLSITNLGSTDLSETTSIDYDGARVKMIFDGAGSVAFKYWDTTTDTWLQLGSFASYAYTDATMFMRFSIASDGNISVRTWDDLYITENDYATETP